MEKSSTARDRIKTRLFDMVSVGVVDDRLNQSYDIISTLFLIINLVVSFAVTFESFYRSHYLLLHYTEAVTVFFFALDYILRLYTADRLYPRLDAKRSALKYAVSGYGIIDLLSFLPYYLPVFFPSGAAVFRMFRVVRIFRLFRINAYYDSLNVIGNVVNAKKTQLLASIFIIMLLIFASSLCMYSVEHQVQPDVFKNALSGMWWATSTLFTVGYGDIYPVTALGQFLAVVITFLGVGLVAIPTGIMSAGFVEEYQKAKRLSDIEKQSEIRFIETELKKDDSWVGVKLKNLKLARDLLIAAVVRGKSTIVPFGELILEEGDRLIICARTISDGIIEDLKEIILKKNHSWNGMKIMDLDISRQTFIVLIERNNRMIIPSGKLKLREGDRLLLYTKEKINKYKEEPLL